MDLESLHHVFCSLLEYNTLKIILHLALKKRKMEISFIFPFRIIANVLKRKTRSSNLSLNNLHAACGWLERI